MIYYNDNLDTLTYPTTNHLNELSPRPFQLARLHPILLGTTRDQDLMGIWGLREVLHVERIIVGASRSQWEPTFPGTHVSKGLVTRFQYKVSVY